ncbi:hypothetical protein, partial [Prevotella sp.]|uniref:hypothetical protein n=1 Tax=Prevotella sp. TaxID=59823 RepID=UPI00257B1540
TCSWKSTLKEKVSLKKDKIYSFMGEKACFYIQKLILTKKYLWFKKVPLSLQRLLKTVSFIL